MTVGRLGIVATRKQWESVGLKPRTPPDNMRIVEGTVVYLPDDRRLAIVTAVKSDGDGQFTKFRLVTDDGNIYDVAGVPMVAIAKVDIQLKTK